jgi:hypothetical protein
MGFHVVLSYRRHEHGYTRTLIIPPAPSFILLLGRGYRKDRNGNAGGAACRLSFH